MLFHTILFQRKNRKGVDNMKKITNMFIMLMIFISISSLAIADDTEENDDEGFDTETEQEIEIMNNSVGSEIRLLQLQKAIIKNILKGEMAVDVLKGLDYNTSSMELILLEMKVLLEDVKEVNTSSNDSLLLFIEYKSNAKNLTTQFRETIRDMLSGEKLVDIRKRISEMASEELENYSKMIRNKIKQFNRNQMYKLYGIIGESNNSFVNEYYNGNISLRDVKIQINKKLNQMNRERKFEIFSEIKKEKIKNKISSNVSIDDFKNKGNGKGK